MKPASRAARRRSSSPPAPPPTPRRSRARWAATLIILAGGLTYATSLSVPFIFDDFGNIVRNPQIRDVWNWAQIFSPPVYTGVAGRPLVHLSLAVNYALGGLNVRGYHVVSVALHVACALLVFGVIRRTLDAIRKSDWAGLRSVDLACAAAVLWAVHPLTSEVVDYLSQRTESMMALCYLLTLYASLRAIDARRPWRWLVTAVAACAAGMACKESMVTAPVMVVIFDRVFLFDTIGQAIRRRWPFYGALAATWLLLAGLLASHTGISSGGFATAHTSTWNYLLNQSVIVTRYLRLAIWPSGLVFYYGWARPLGLLDVWPYALFLVLLFVATLLAVARWPRAAFPGLWVFVTLAPTSSFVPIAAEVGAERRMYLPLVGIVTLAVIGAAALRGRLIARSGDQVQVAPAVRESPYALRLDRLTVGVAVVAAILLSAVTMARTREYGSALAMAETVLVRWPTPNAEQLVGQELAATGQHEAAIRHLQRALPDFPPAHYFLGTELFTVGRFDEAMAQLQAFVAEEPSLPPVRSARMLMARVFAARREMPRAIEQLHLVLASAPADSAAHALLADVLAKEHEFGDAIPHYQAVLTARPGDPNAWTGLGVALVATGRGAEAVSAFRQAAAAAPADAHARVNLARALLEAGDAGGARDEAQRAEALAPADPAAHEMLGRVLASLGRTDDARREFERALVLDPSYAPATEALRKLKSG
jgi:tetratricopeptide (TPR) repeat protein